MFFRLFFFPIYLLLFYSTFLITPALAQNSKKEQELKYYNQSAQAYIKGDLTQSKKIVTKGLKLYPSSIKLNAIKKILNEQDKQNQDKQNQDKQNQDKQNQDKQNQDKQNQDKQNQDKQNQDKQNQDKQNQDKQNQDKQNQDKQNQDKQNQDKQNQDKQNDINSTSKQQPVKVGELSKKEAERLLESYNLDEKSQLIKIHTLPSKQNQKIKKDW